MRFLFFESSEGQYNIDELEDKAIELLEFILTMDKGEFYVRAIGKIILPKDLIYYNESHTRFASPEEKVQRGLDYYRHLQAAKERVYALIIELLRFQSW